MTAAEIDEVRLGRWFEQHVPGYRGPLQLERFSGGQSNPTYRVRTPQASYVLRRKPPGPLIKGAHAVEREAQVMSALGKTGFPVPHVHALCEDPEVIGSAFYVMDMVEGRIFWDASFSQLPREARSSHMDAMNQTLAALHAIDPDAVGLGGYGRKGAYVERQVARWSKQYLEDEAAGRHPSMDRLVEWLPRHLPRQEETTVVHGDFRADNMIFHPTEPRVVAVLDWELSTLGDPLADFAYHAMTYRMPREVQGGIAGLDAASHGLPTEAEYVAAYCRRTGRESLAQLDYYIAFNMFRFAAILHGIQGRVLRGTAANAQARQMGELFRQVADLAWVQAEAAGA
jgi:aminoglycoside phosphotransferase (APT) family kinase protein